MGPKPLDAEHSSIGEPFGVKRGWHVAERGDDDVVDLCYDASAGRETSGIDPRFGYRHRYQIPGMGRW